RQQFGPAGNIRQRLGLNGVNDQKQCSKEREAVRRLLSIEHTGKDALRHEVDEDSIQKMEQQIDKVISPHVFAIDSVIGGESDVQQCAGEQVRRQQGITQLNSRIHFNCGEIIKDEGNIEGIPIREHAHCCKNAANSYR